MIQQEIIDARVAAVLADTNPEMKYASDHPELLTRVRIMLDGEDVTRLCRAFSIPAQQVELLVEENSRKLFEWGCGCGTTRGPRSAFGGAGQCCRICCQEIEGPSVAVDVHRGKVEVRQKLGLEMKLSPGDYLAEFVDSPLPVRLSRIRFTLTLWGPSLRRRPIQAARDVLPILWRIWRGHRPPAERAA